MLQFSDSLHVAKRYRCKHSAQLHCTQREHSTDKTYTHNTVLCEIGATARRVRGSVALGRAARHTGRRPQRDARAQPREASLHLQARQRRRRRTQTSTWKGAAARLHGPEDGGEVVEGGLWPLPPPEIPCPPGTADGPKAILRVRGRCTRRAVRQREGLPGGGRATSAQGISSWA